MLNQSAICHNNDAHLEIAMSYFFHCENIPDCVVESPMFRYLLSQAQLFKSDFKPPTQK